MIPRLSPLPRPLVWLAVAFTTGVCAEHFCPRTIPSTGIIVVVSALVLCLLTCLFKANLRTCFPLLALLTFLGLGFLSARAGSPALPYPPQFDRFLDRPQTLFLAEIDSPPDFYPDKIRFTLRLQSALVEGETVPVDGGVLLTIARTRMEHAGWVPGDRVLARLTLKRFSNFNNPGGYDYVRSQAERGLYARASFQDDRFLVRLAPERESPFHSLLHRARGGLDRFRQDALFWLRDSLPDPAEASFYAALLLGYQQFLSSAWKEDLSRVGITHLLSISGMHLGLVSMFTFWICRRLVRVLNPSVLRRFADKHIALWPALFSAVLYAFIAGFGTPPIWRSLLMLSICLGAALCYRHADALSVLAATALIILTIDPASLRQISFQLTYACMAAIFIIYPKFERFRLSGLHPAFARQRLLGKILRPFEEAFWVSVAVNILVLPLTVFYFQGFSLAGFAANIVLVPLVGFLVLPPGLVALAVFAVNAPLALPILKFGAWWLGISQDLILFFSHLSWAYFWVGAVPVIWVAAFYAGAALLLSPLRLRGKAACGLVLLVLFSGVSAAGSLHRLTESREGLVVHSIDVGQGTSTLVRFPGGETMLVDGGGFFDDSFDVGRAVVAPFLWGLGVRKLDHVVLSHDHPDHRNGLRFILSHFDVGNYWTSGMTENASGLEPLSRIASARAVPVRICRDLSGPADIGGCRVRIVHPDKKYLESSWTGDLNNASLVVRIDYGETSLVLPGDIDRLTERHVFDGDTAWGKVFLVAAHHGSEHSTDPSTLDRLRPQAVVFSCGPGNRFGFPAPAVIERCAERSIPVYRTDLQGAVRAVSDGRKWTITTESDRDGNAQERTGKDGKYRN